MSNARQRLTLLSWGAALPALLLFGTATAQSTPERTQTFEGTLTSLNGSGVTGTFTIEQKGQGQMRVIIKATGLEVTPQPHVAHIHYLESNEESMCPTLEQDDDGDGFIELAEGLDTYGPIVVPLGDVDPDNDGVVNYSQTFNLQKDSTFDDDSNLSELLPLELREIVIHGMTVGPVGAGTPGEVNGEAGYKVVLPIACGGIDKASETRRGPKEVRMR